MTIATLIAAGRLEERLLRAAIERLTAHHLPVTVTAFVEPGSAVDLEIGAGSAAIRSILENWEGVDIVPHTAGRGKRRLFVADMDSTMIGQECIDELADYAGFKPQVAAITERAMRGELDFVGALRERVALLHGLDAQVIDRCLSERVRPNAGAATLVNTLKDRGVRTILVSGGFTAFARPVAGRLGFDEFEANVLQLRDGVLTGEVEGPIVDSSRKAAVARAALEEIEAGAEKLLAVGDGANDAPLIQLAGMGIGYRPKPTLAAVADALLLHHDLDALLWAEGIPSSQWLRG